MSSQDFFVPWLPLSAQHRRFAVGIGIATLLLMAGVAALIAANQSPLNEGVIPPSGSGELIGITFAKPYAHLITKAPDGTETTYLFVSGGKGANALPADLDGVIVRASGQVMERAGTRLLVSPNLSALNEGTLDREDIERLRTLQTTALGAGPIRLEGEIVDSKCHLGAMRPGRGPTHRACAQICIEGGVPPILVMDDTRGEERHAVLCGPSGQPVNLDVLPFVALPVAIQGHLFQRGGLHWFEMTAEAITPL